MVHNIFYGVKQPDALCDLPPVNLNTWVSVTYLKQGSTLTWLQDGVEVAKVVLDRPSVANTGSLWIGRMPEAYGVPEAGFDNFQVHNKALTSNEI